MVSPITPIQKHPSVNLTFRSKSETFWKLYNKNLKGVPLKDTIIKSITDNANFLGEGLSKKGYNFTGLKDYVIRVYKKCFRQEDLDKEFSEPKNNRLNILEGVVLSIPGKIDIVKKKNGVSLGVDNYAQRIQIEDFPPLRNVCVKREETLRALKLYNQLKDFHVTTYKQAHIQMKKFCNKPDFQFDIISPNNILVDAKRKKINLIDPVTPIVNEPVHGKNIRFSDFHGCDSLYPVLCDFLMQKEHINNLTDSERTVWQKSVNMIILKSIRAAEEIGYGRNIDKMKILYDRITNFWKTDELRNRYDSFLDMYEGAINQNRVIETALNYKNTVKDRISAINKLEAIDFNELKPVFEKLIEAPHQPKVEFPEIINAVLDKLSEYGNEVCSLVPSFERLFDKEIFCTTKKRLYQLFLKLQPDNPRFLEEIKKSSLNSIEKHLFKQEILSLYEKNKTAGKDIYKNSLKNENLFPELADKLWISRTCTNKSSIQTAAINNMLYAYDYIKFKNKQKPKIADLIEIHKLILAGIPGEQFLAGKLRTPDTDELVRQVFHVTKDVKTVVNDYSPSKNVVNDLKELDKYIDEKYEKSEIFTLAANLYSKLIAIHPFVNGNGRAVRLFIEQFLLSKGYHLKKWPEEALYRKLFSTNQLAECLKQNSIKTE